MYCHRVDPGSRIVAFYSEISNPSHEGKAFEMTDKNHQFNKQSLEYHAKERKGKLEVTSSKPCLTQRDLSLAYSPGVAAPCLEIAKDKDKVFEYTNKGQLVGVVSNGTAVLGLGNIGPEASKPVMEGKGVLFKRFADIDVYDIELNAKTPEEVIQACIALEPTFGGINLEDIKAPECFEIEETLKEKLEIPVFHDDQHGTAIITAAGFLNALEISERKIKDTVVVMSGAGAAAVAIADLLISMGLKKKNLYICDSRGVIYKGRKDGMNKYKEKFAVDTPHRSLKDAMKKADAFLGVSVKGAVTKDMVKSMAKNPIIFAMANPDPEITPEEVAEVRDDAIMATGRSDYPNQVNNVLGFPFIFRGALDVRAKSINEEMKLAAVKALAALAKEDVPDQVLKAYGGKNISYGRDYLIPKPFDRRVLLWVAPAVAKAASDSGVARFPLKNEDEYRSELEKILGGSYVVMHEVKRQLRTLIKSKKHTPTIVFPEGSNPKVLKAAEVLKSENLCDPILLGYTNVVKEKIEELNLEHLKDVPIIWPSKSDKLKSYAEKFTESRQRKGMTEDIASRILRTPNYFGPMMVEMGDADGIINGSEQAYNDVIKPMIEVFGVQEGVRLAGVYAMIFKEKMLFFADTTVNIDPTAKQVADIAIMTSDLVQNFFGVEPRVGMLSFSNFGSNSHPKASKMREATELVWNQRPDLNCDGEMQADTAVVYDIIKETFPFCKLKGPANILVFPDLNSANTCYKLLDRIGNAETLGPILLGLNRPANVVQRTGNSTDIVNMAAFTALRTLQKKNNKKKSK
jgi:malate dehydrogenase (oxaloacetate-decarboxylating)(NADP+)